MITTPIQIPRVAIPTTGGDAKVISFLQVYMDYTEDDAIEFATENPAKASELVEKVKKSILDDRSITEKYKEKIRQS